MKFTRHTPGTRHSRPPTHIRGRILTRMRSLVTLLLIPASFAAAQGGHLLLRNPALSNAQIVFTYAGDLWSVPRQGGEARRLTAGPGVETGAVFSPDGSTIAFTGEYDGQRRC